MALTSSLILVLAGASLTLALFTANIIIAAKHGSTDMRVTIAVHVIGVATALANLIRIYGLLVDTVVAANVVAVICIIISLWRNLKEAGE